MFKFNNFNRSFEVDEFLLVRRKSPRINELIWTSWYKLEVSVKLNHAEKNKTNTCLKWANELFEGWINTDTSGLGTSLLRALEMFSVEPIITQTF